MFARNRYDSAHYKRILKKNGVRVESVLEHLDDSPESIMLESVLEDMAEYYSKNLAREVRKGMRENAATMCGMYLARRMRMASVIPTTKNRLSSGSFYPVRSRPLSTVAFGIALIKSSLNGNISQGG